MNAKKTKGLVDANLLTLLSFGAAGRNRTHDPLVRSQVLYPAELQPLWKDNSIARISYTGYTLLNHFKVHGESQEP